MLPLSYNIQTMNSIKATNWGFKGEDCVYNQGFQM